LVIMLLKNALTDLADFTDKVYTGLKLREIILEFRTGSTSWPQTCNVCERPSLLCLFRKAFKGMLKVCDIEQFLEIVDELPLDNTVAIHVTSVPAAFSRITAKKCASLPNNILFTNIQELDRVIEGYFLTKQDS
ncbi:4168_t:CDS:2, partial [Racocetra persica]